MSTKDDAPLIVTPDGRRWNWHVDGLTPIVIDMAQFARVQAVALMSYPECDMQTTDEELAA